MGPARKVQVFSALFVVLTGLAVYWALSRAGLDAASLRQVLDLGFVDILVLIALAMMLYAADLLRYRAIGRSLEVSIGYRAALEASIANFFFSWLTPGSTFGAPATIFMLHRHNVPWGAAGVIAFAKSLTGVAFFVGAAAIIFLVGWGPELDERVTAVVIPGLVLLSLALGILLLSALFAEGVRRSLAA
ncbi:MAG: hypothetical protein GY811_11815, partial [Myxococcales bacterium]|nr:hypothetical protein [Myxococcales bacterium]